MKTFLFALLLLVPSVSHAAPLTALQVDSIIGLLYAFGVDQPTINLVRSQLVAPVSAYPIINPTFGNISPMPKTPTIETPVSKAGIKVSVVHIAPADKENGSPYRSYILKVQVLDAEGNPINGAPIQMDGPTKIASEKLPRTIDTTTTLHSKDYYRNFGFTPSKKGEIKLKFTSGDLATTYTLIVE